MREGFAARSRLWCRISAFRLSPDGFEPPTLHPGSNPRWPANAATSNREKVAAFVWPRDASILEGREVGCQTIRQAVGAKPMPQSADTNYKRQNIIQNEGIETIVFIRSTLNKNLNFLITWQRIKKVGLVTGPGGLFATRLVAESGGLATNPSCDKPIEDYNILQRSATRVCNRGFTRKVWNGREGSAAKPYLKSQLYNYLI